MKHKMIIINLFFVGLLCLFISLYLYQKEMISGKPSFQKSETKAGTEPVRFDWISRRPEVYYIEDFNYYKKQEIEYQKALDTFIQYKDTLEQIIDETRNLEIVQEMSYFLLGEGWKRQLDLIPGSELLDAYEEYFFVYKAKSTKNGPIWIDYLMEADEDLYHQVAENDKLAKSLNLIGKSGDVMEIVFCENSVLVKLTGPFFKEGFMVMMEYVYEGKESGYMQESKEDMWLDDHWVMYVPYPRQD